MSEPANRHGARDPRAGLFLGALALATVPLLAGSCGGGHHEPGHGNESGEERRLDADVEVPPRTPVLATYPCVEQCHRTREPNPSPRPLREFHSLKQIVHGDTTFWCNFCHNLENLDNLRLLDNRTVTFDEAWRLCGECHGDKRRDWEYGIHGLQTGSWSGRKVRRTCTACHDPHSPRRPKFEALPPPRPRTGEP